MGIAITTVTSKIKVGIHSSWTQMLEVDPHSPISMIRQIRSVQDPTPSGFLLQEVCGASDKTAYALMAPFLQSRHISLHLHLHPHAQDR